MLQHVSKLADEDVAELLLSAPEEQPASDNAQRAGVIEVEELQIETIPIDVDHGRLDPVLVAALAA